jgi:Spy/CpxP family protein refolding chaperone
MRGRLLLGIAGAASALLIAGSGFAQDQAPAGGGHRGGGCMAGAMHDLNLTDEQRAKIKEIREASEAGPDRRHAIEQVLTPDQRDKLAAARKQCEAERGH